MVTTALRIKLDLGAYLPERAHKTDAGLDLRCMESATIQPWRSHTFDTGVHVELPPGHYGKIESKSGLNVNHNIVSCGGVIDEGFTGSIKVKLYNLCGLSYHFDAGDKIAQLIIQPYAAPVLIEVDALDQTERGDNGFGSTGK